jgi:hypothetical protein
MADISRVLMPRAYIEMILSSNPGKRRWYLAISCGSKLAWRYARNLQLDLTGIGDDRLLAVTVAPVARLLAGKVMVQLGIHHPLGQRLLQIVEQAIRIESRLRSSASHSWSRMATGIQGSLRRGIAGRPLFPSCPTAARNS